MISLPVCRWRADTATQEYLCRSTKFLQAPNVVPAQTCRECACADHEVPAVLPRALPCVHLGEWTGKRVTPLGGASRDLFACVLHGRCAADGTERKLPGKVPACSHCDDYLPRDPFGPNSAEMLQRAEELLANLPEYPAKRYQGRGIVVAGGGDKYFASLYVTVRALRHVGCQLPIQVWYLGRNQEMPADKQALLAPWQVECVDADKVRRRHPARRLDGWELKVFATLHSPFEEVLFLDADCYPCRNPEFLFELADYRKRGAIFWPDLMAVDTRLQWPAFGVPGPNRPGSIESGQFVLHKRTSWRALNLAWFYNDHSDYYYSYGYGDKHTFEVAWASCETPYVMWRNQARWVDVAFLHSGPDGEALFVHRCCDKFRLDCQQFTTFQQTSLPRFYPALPLERECWNWLAELARSIGAPLVSPEGTVGKPVQVEASSIVLATLYTPEIADYGRYTAAAVQEYATRHGHRALIQLSTLDRSRPPSWSKIRLIERAFAADVSCEWVMWIDADALIVEPQMRLTEFLDDDADLIIGDDSPNGPLCAGVFLARNCRSVKELLRRAYAKRQYIHHRLWEQIAIADTVRERVRGLRVKIVPRRKFNSFAEEYKPGDFIIHFAGRSDAERSREIRCRAVMLRHPPPAHFRPDTNDRGIFEAIYNGNEYRLPDDMAGATVLDIGGHLGSFAYACAARGAREIWSVEALPENFRLLERHLAEMTFPGTRVPIFAAAWRSDRRPPALRIEPGDGDNRAAFRLTEGKGEKTKAIRFDDIVRRLTRDGERRIDLLKLDCEGSEFPILFTSRTLGWIDAICAEIHPSLANLPQFQVAGQQNNQMGLRDCLESQGFTVTCDAAPSSAHHYHLWARRPNL